MLWLWLAIAALAVSNVVLFVMYRATLEIAGMASRNALRTGADLFEHLYGFAPRSHPVQQ